MLRSRIVAGVLAVALATGLAWQGAAAAATPESAGVNQSAAVTALLSSAGVPDQVVRELDPEVVAALWQAVEAGQADVAGDVEAAAIWPVIREFVKRYWSRIVDAAKRAGVWAWSKAHICAYGAGQALYRFSGGNPAVIAGDPKGALAAATYGCIQELRK
jgi:hypothetical protein